MTNRISAVLLIAICAGAAAQESANERTRADDLSVIAEFVESHCFDCHSGEEAEGGFRLDEIAPNFDDRGRFRSWVHVYDRVAGGEMPPADAARPAQPEVDTVLAALGRQLRFADQERQRVEGRISLRRLNRVEYEYTLQDLLALPNLQVKEMLPPDDAAHGFDNVAEAQDISYVQMARYLEAAEVALDSAMRLGPEPESTTVRMKFQSVGRLSAKQQRGRGESRFIDEWVVFLRQPNSAQTPWRLDNKRQHEPGWYRFRIRCRGVTFDDGRLLPPEQNHVASLYTGAKRLLHTFDVPPEPDVVEFTAWQNEEELLEFFCATLDDRNSPGAGPIPDKPYRGPGIAVDYLEIEGPLAEKWPPECHRRLFGDLPVRQWTAESGLAPPAPLNIPDLTGNKRGGNPNKKRKPQDMWMVVSDAPHQDAERLLREFLARAYRRPADESEVRRCLAFALDGIDKKLCFQDSMRTAYVAALCSPDFLFLIEQPGELDDYALAARLSYFLWRSLPDEPLRKLAASGGLKEPGVLDEQVERMLEDSKAERFFADFAGQWLDLRKIHDTAPDRYLYPEYFCDTYLIESAVQETVAYFGEMVRRDLAARHVVASDFAMLNERLAELYGIQGVEGSEIRSVPLPEDAGRGGFLTQAAVLKVTANGLTTSPVLRGAWVRDRLLGRGVPPPPPDAGAIDPDTRGATTIRQQLALHRRDQSCAVCHVKIDPPGFALESFDVMGARRDRYRGFEQGDEADVRVADRPVRYKLAASVDCSGETEDGQKFDDIKQIRRLLLRQEEQLARNLVERSLTFATGAGISFADRAVVDDILALTRDKEYGLRSMIHEIVRSDAFRRK